MYDLHVYVVSGAPVFSKFGHTQTLGPNAEAIDMTVLMRIVKRKTWAQPRKSLPSWP